jgi:hypothetical protein
MMSNRRSRSAWWPALLAIGLTALPAAAGAAEIPWSWSGVERIVAVGDVHGDCDTLVKLLRAAGVVDERDAWAGGKTHLVQTGDILGRGPNAKQAMDLLRKLETEAEAAGGRVHALIGNHETMVMTGYYHYVPPAGFESFGGRDGMRRAFLPQGEYGKWIAGHNAAIRINEVLFMHAGISRRYAQTDPAALNASVRKALAEGKDEKNEILTADDGPLWYRGFAEHAESGLKAELEAVFKTWGVRRAVVGHTPGDGIRTRAEGRVVLIDVGMSRYYREGLPECLLIEQGKWSIVTPTAKRDLGVPAEPVPAKRDAQGALRQ